jgi:hypothetical protein
MNYAEGSVSWPSQKRVTAWQDYTASVDSLGSGMVASLCCHPRHLNILKTPPGTVSLILSTFVDTDDRNTVLTAVIFPLFFLHTTFFMHTKKVSDVYNTPNCLLYNVNCIEVYARRSCYVLISMPTLSLVVNRTERLCC